MKGYPIKLKILRIIRGIQKSSSQWKSKGLFKKNVRRWKIKGYSWKLARIPEMIQGIQKSWPRKSKTRVHYRLKWFQIQRYTRHVLSHCEQIRRHILLFFNKYIYSHLDLQYPFYNYFDVEINIIMHLDYSLVDNVRIHLSINDGVNLFWGRGFDHLTFEIPGIFIRFYTWLKWKTWKGCTCCI